MPNHHPLPCQWQAKRFFILQIISFGLLASWIFPSPAALWQWIDVPFFRLINSSLGHWQIWDIFWALLSTRLSDVLALLTMLWLLMRRDLVFSQAQLRSALIGFVALLFFMLLIRVGFSQFLSSANLKHGSPSHLLDHVYRLSSCYPSFGKYLSVKDSAASSFPGDHATILILWISFMAFFARGKKLLLVLFIGLLFMTPRLIAGAHWLSDNLVGGGFIVLQTLAWFYCTALGNWLHRVFYQLSRPCFAILEKTPLLNRLAIAQPIQ